MGYIDIQGFLTIKVYKCMNLKESYLDFELLGLKKLLEILTRNPRAFDEVGLENFMRFNIRDKLNKDHNGIISLFFSFPFLSFFSFLFFSPFLFFFL